MALMTKSLQTVILNPHDSFRSRTSRQFAWIKLPKQHSEEVSGQQSEPRTRKTMLLALGCSTWGMKILGQNLESWTCPQVSRVTSHLDSGNCILPNSGLQWGST